MRRVITSFLLLAAPLAAHADPLVAKGGKPGAAKSWSTGADGTILLELVPGFTPEAVVTAIHKGVPGAKAAAQGGKVAVTGVDEAKLLVALEKVDVSADDVDAMVSALQGPGGDEGSGSSIRATQAMDMGKAGVVDRAVAELVPGTVISVKHGKYPFVAVTLKLDVVPKALADAGVKAGSKLTVVPRVQLENGRIAPADERSKTNIGAWYARTGDRIQVQVEGQSPQGFWVAARFERAR